MNDIPIIVVILKMKNKILDTLRTVFQKTPNINEAFVKNSEAFCLMPWVHLHVSQLGTVTPCCQARWEAEYAFGNINEQSVAEIWHGEKMNAFRKDMLNDKKHLHCERCYIKEAVGLMSLRQVTNQLYAHKLEWAQNTTSAGETKDAKPIYWDIRFSNLCNFRCRICGPWSSSRWFDEAQKLGISGEGAKRVTHGVENFEDVLAQLKPFVHEVEEIYFAGGEPLIMEEHYRILDFLAKNGLYNVFLRYSTNFSVVEYKGRSVFEIWKKFKNINVSASLDGMHKQGEFQRKEQDWQQVLDNRKRMVEVCPHVEFIIAATISVFNVWHLPDFHRQWYEDGLITDIKNIWPNILEQPEYYNIAILPPSLKQKIEQKYRKHIAWLEAEPTDDEYRRAFVVKEFKHCIEHLNAHDWTHRIGEFKAWCKKLDVLRGESTLETFPELQEVFDF